MSLGFAVSPVVLDLLVSKFDKTGGKNKAIEYDNFIEYVFLGRLFNLLLFLFDKWFFPFCCLFILRILPLSISNLVFSSFFFLECRCCLTVKVSS